MPSSELADSIGSAGSPRQPILELAGVSRTFDEGSVGIRNVDLRIWPGEFVAIVGPSGAGKSTLLNVLGLLDSIDVGRQRIDGVDVTALSSRERDLVRGVTFGYVFQSAFVLGAETALANAALAVRTIGVPLVERGAAAHSALESVGLTHRSGGRAALLSGGERQRLALARTLATKPRVIFADEPTGNLDSANGDRVLGLLREMHTRGTTIVLVTHDLQIAQNADRVVEVIDGRVDEGQSLQGPPVVTPEADVVPRERAKRASRLRARPDHIGRIGARRLPRQGRWAAFIDDVGDAVSALTSRLGRSLLLVSAFALGVGGLVASIGLSETAAAQVTDRLDAAALDEVQVTLALDPGDLDYAEQLDEWGDAAEELDHVEAVATVVDGIGSASAGVRRTATSPQLAASLDVISVSSSYIELLGGETVGPAAVHLLDAPTTDRVAVLGERAAEALGIAAATPGAAFWISGQRVDVVGIVQGRGDAAWLGDAVIVSDRVLAGLNGTVRLVVRTEVGYPAAVADALPLALDPINPGAFRVETVADLRLLRFGVTNDLGVLVGAVATLVLIFTTLSAATTMYLSVQARAAEIALRRALGAGRGAVARLFVVEALIVGASGGAIGALLGLGTAILLAHVEGWEPVFPPSLGAIGLGLGLLTSVVSALVPSLAASRSLPAEAMRLTP